MFDNNLFFKNERIIIKNNYPSIKGFTKRNIERMIQLYSTYKNDEIATPLVTQLSWTNKLLILSGAKSKEERLFYLKLSIIQIEN